MTCASSLVSIARTAKAYWEKLQVELHGEFPADHVNRYEEYAAHTSVWRALLACLWTSVPSIAVAAKLELNPIEDWRTHSARQSPRFILRCFIMLAIICLCYLEQFRQHEPSLQLSRRLMLPMALVGSGFAMGAVFPIVDHVAYPFPFIANVTALAGAPALIGMLLFAVRDQIRTNPHLAKD